MKKVVFFALMLLVVTSLFGCLPENSGQSSTQPPITSQTESTAPTEPGVEVPELPAPKKLWINSYQTGDSTAPSATEDALPCLRYAELYDEETGIQFLFSDQGGYHTLTNTDWDELLLTLPTLPVCSLIYASNLDHPSSPLQGEVTGVEVYSRTEDGAFISLDNFIGTVETLASLPAGNWYAIITVVWQGDYIESAEAYETYCYDYLLILEGPEAALYSGEVNDTVTWAVDTSTGTLTISGTGSMGELEYAPWYGYRRCITSLVIEQGITEIVGFSNLPHLTSVDIPESVVTIGKEAFYGCDWLQEIYLPDTVTSIGSYAFAHCQRLEQINIPASLTTIPWGMFTYCLALKEVSLHDRVTTIEDYAFAHCDSLERISLPDSVTTLGASAIENCYSLCSVTLSSNLTHIANHAFSTCTSLTEIVIPDSVTSIDSYAFSDCRSLQKIVIGPNMEHIGNTAFFDCYQLKGFTISADNPYITADATGPIFNKDKTEVLLMAPGYTDVYEVPDGVTTITLWSFYGCALSGVILPDTVTTIEEYAFANCKNLEFATLSENLKVIEFRAFMSCKSLREITIPASVEAVETDAFSRCSAMQSATFLGPYPEFDGRVFDHVTGYLYYPPFDPEWESAPQLTAADMEWLPYICVGGHTIKTLPGQEATCTEDGITEGQVCTVCCETILGQRVIPATGHALSDWELVTSDDSQSLFRRHCKSCDYFEEKHIDPADYPPAEGFCGESLKWRYADGVLTISGSGAMEEFSNVIFPPWYEYSPVISQVILPDGLRSISEYAFVGLIQLREITIPDAVTSIGANAFEGCTRLTSITIPDNVWDIGSMAFSRCASLESVTVGAGVTGIGIEAFYGCDALSWVKFTGSMPSMEEAFLGLTLTIYYPAGDDTWDPSLVSTVDTNITWVPVEEAP